MDNTMRYKIANKIVKQWIDRLSLEELVEMLAEEVTEEILFQYSHIKDDEAFKALVEAAFCEVLEGYIH